MDSRNRLQVAVLSINNHHYPIYEGVNTVGRNREAIVNLRHMNISQNHAIIVIVNGQHFISDLKSSNGSICEDSKMEPFKLYQLDNNAQVTLGGLLGTYVLEGPFPNENNFLQTSIAPSQSFYGCHTQLLESSASQNIDIHDAPTQEICWSSLKHKHTQAKKTNLAQSDDIFIVPQNPPPLKDSVLDLSDHFNDENLPILENFSERLDIANKEEAIHEEESEITEIKKSAEEDDEVTDCEEDGPVKLENISHTEINVPPIDSDTSAATRTTAKTLSSPDSDENSSDSMEFLKREKSPVKMTAEANVNDTVKKDLNSDSDTENLTFKRSKKSLMVISTQDFTDESLNLQVNESETDNSVVDKRISYNDSCSDSVMELRGNDNFEDIIPATQEFNDSDFIPSTQHSNKFSGTGESQNKNKNVGLSEESFKLGLTEMMIESSEGVNNLDKLSSINTRHENKEELDIYNVPTQKFVSDTRKSESSCVNGDDTFAAPTQKIIDVDAVPVSNPNEVSDDTFLAPTQKIIHDKVSDLNEKLEVAKSTSDDTFLAPTQKIVNNRGHLEESKFCSDSQDTEMYDCPTQKIDFNTAQEPPRPAPISETENIFDCPTQVLAADVPMSVFSKSQETSEIYDAPTQKFSKCQESTEIYDAPTQKLHTDSKEIGETVCASEDETYLAPTQKIIEFEGGNLGEENNSSKPTEEPSTNNKGSKKTFSFKKKQSDLNASLSFLADDNLFKVPKERNIPKSDSELSTKSKEPINSEANAQSDSDTITPPSKELKATCDLEDDIEMRPVHSENELNSGDTSTKKDDTDTSSKPADLTESTLNATGTDVNKSMALFESKIKKTKKSSKAADVHITVPKNRRSMTISKVEEPLKTLKDSSLDNDPSSSDSRRSSKRRNTTKKQPDFTNLKENKSTRRSKVEAADSKEKNTSRRSKSTKVAGKNKNTIDTSDENVTNLDNGHVDNKSRQTISHVESQVKRPSRRKARSYSSNNNLPEDSSDVKEGTSSDEPDKASKVTKRKKTLPEDVSGEQSVSPAKKQRLQLNDTISDAAQRGLRKQRPKVVFTMLESPQLESLIKQLGGSVVDSVDTCTVVVTERVKRSQKLLTAVGLGKPICSPKWITDSKKSQEFLDPWDYILADAEAEKKWDFSLKESLNRSKAQKLLESYSFHLQVTNGSDVLKGAIEACGGKCLAKIPPTPLENAYIISSNENQSKYSRLLKKHPHFKAIEAEAIFDGVLRQELRFPRHILK